MSINTIDNKKLLWATLQDNNCFEGLQDHSFRPVQQQFENFILQNEKKRGSLINKNKQVIRSMVQYLKKIKTQAKTQSTPQVQRQKNMQVNPPSSPAKQPHKREDLQAERLNMFEDRLKKRQEEFTNLIEKNRPKDIDFADKNKDSYNNIMDESEKFIKQRENDLHTFPEKPVTENKKLQIDNSDKGEKQAKQETENIVITISDDKDAKNKDSENNEKITKTNIKNIGKKVTFENVKHSVDEEITPEKKSKNTHKNNKLKSPPPPIVTEESPNNTPDEINELKTLIKSLQAEMKEIKENMLPFKTLRKNVNQLKEEINSINSGQTEIKEMKSDIAQLKSFETSIYKMKDTEIESISDMQIDISNIKIQLNEIKTNSIENEVENVCDKLINHVENENIK